MTNIEYYANKLANKIQISWEEYTRNYYQEYYRNTEEPLAKANYLQILEYQRDGLYDYRRHYHVLDKGDYLQINWTCNVSGMPKIHCVINKETGDVAKYNTELVNEAFFQFNLMDENSRLECFSLANFDREYLNLD